MRYVIKKKLFSWGDNYKIRDEDGMEVLYVNGRGFSLGPKLSLQDMAGNELAFIRLKLLAWGHTYEIYRTGELAAVVKRQSFTTLGCRFTLEIVGADSLEARSNLLDREYTFLRAGQSVATMRRKLFSLTDTYRVEIAPGEDQILLLASTVAIVQDRRKR